MESAAGTCLREAGLRVLVRTGRLSWARCADFRRLGFQRLRAAQREVWTP